MKMRSPRIAIEPKPSPRFDIDQLCRGPDDGHCLRSPVSFDTPLRSGPRHCGQSVGPLGTVFGGAEEFAVSEDDDAWTENQMKRRTAGSASDRAHKRMSFIQFPLSATFLVEKRGSFLWIESDFFEP
jgi:hypothetical protein